MELKGNVVCYMRVSTRHDEQADSLENQELLLIRFLEENPGLRCVGWYKDVESGKTTERKDFLNMIDKIADGDVDYILAKNHLRLHRSTEIGSSLNRYCLNYGCKIYYVGNNELYDPKERSQVLMSHIKNAVAEDYVYQQSELGKLSHRMKCKEKRLNRQNEMYGYRFNTKTKEMEVVESEADIVRLIFEWYCYENKGVTQIGKDLAKIGVVNSKNGKQFSATTITKRLANPAYIGKMPFNKFQSELVTGVGAKTIKRSRPKEEWVYGECPAIISEELFALAQKIRAERVHVYKVDKNKDKNVPVQARFRGHHLFATKIFCKECGNTYHHRFGDSNKTVNVYRDSFHKKSHLPEESCPNNDYSQVYEDQLIEVVIHAVNSFISKQDEVFDNVFSIIREVIKSSDVDEELIRHKKLYEAKLSEKSKWLEAYKDAVASGDALIKDDVMNKYKEVSKQLEEMESLISGFSAESKISDDIALRLEDIKKSLDKMRCLDEITRDDVLFLVDRIVIGKDGLVEVHLTFDEAYSYKIISYKEYKETLRNGSSSFFDKLSAIEVEEIICLKMPPSGTTEVSVQVMPTAYRGC